MSRKNLSIVFWNAQSILPKINELSIFLSQNNIDILIFTETWLKHGLSFLLRSYRVYRKDRHCINPKKRNVGGGVAIAIRADISHSLLKDTHTTTIEAIGIEVNLMNQPIQFYAVYFPGSKLNDIKLTNFKKDLITLSSNRKPFFLCGDLNAKHRLWNCTRANKAGNILFSEMSHRNFSVNFPPTPTYFPPQSNRSNPSTIDIVLTNGYFDVKDIRSLNSLSSDHQPVLFEVETRSKVKPSLTAGKRCYARADWNKFKDIVHNNIDLIQLSSKLNCTSEIDEVLNFFTNIIKEAENVSVPFFPQARPTSTMPDPEVAHLISVKNLMRRQWQRLRLPDLKREVNFLTKSIRRLSDKSNNADLNRNLSEIKPNSNQLWRVIKLLRNKGNRIPPLKSSTGSLLITDIEKAEEIGKVFVNAHSTTYFDRSDAMTEAEVSASSLNLNFFSAAVSESQMPTPSEISQLIRQLKVKKSPGNDAIPNILLKHLPRKGIVLFMYIVRACLRLSYFPTTWKTAKVTPIPKAGKDLSSPSNYRPISLLNSLSKIFEKIILSRLNDYLSRNKIIPNEQFGFRRGHSTNHQLLRVSRFIQNSLNLKQSTGMLTFDIEKAFDSVWHKGLLYKMFKLKVPLYLIKIIGSYISQRSFFVSINGTNSPTHDIIAGLPQGSVLSPTLFNIFTSDLVISASEKGLYADDTTVFSAGKSPNKIIKNLNASCEQLAGYCSKWKIKLNSGKTQALYFTRRRANRWLPSSEISVRGSRVHWSNDIKYLGITLDKTLNFNQHINLAVEKATKFLGILFVFLNRKSRLNTINKISIYKSMIRSILLNACPVWGSCAESHLNKLQLVQNKCLRLILKTPFNHPTYDLHAKSKLPMLKVQIQKINLKFKNKLRMSDNPLIRLLH
jgi:exonuclease III